MEERFICIFIPNQFVDTLKDIHVIKELSKHYVNANNDWNLEGLVSKELKDK
ncbi:hypothetical protein RYX36_030558 [Vicia faba]